MVRLLESSPTDGEVRGQREGCLIAIIVRCSLVPSVPVELCACASR